MQIVVVKDPVPLPSYLPYVISQGVWKESPLNCCVSPALCTLTLPGMGWAVYGFLSICSRPTALEGV